MRFLMDKNFSKKKVKKYETKWAAKHIVQYVLSDIMP